MNLSTLFILSAFAWLSVGCSLSKKSKPDGTDGDKRPEGPELVGRIAAIPADKRFVLVQSYGSWNIESGTVLTTLGQDDRTANLLVTGEKLGQFAAADIQSGKVEIGDAVYSRRKSKPAASDSNSELISEHAEKQGKKPNQSVQKNN